MSKAMEYKVNLKLVIFNEDRSNHLSAYKEIMLPFIPYVGLWLNNTKEMPAKITDVTWSIDEKYFFCILEDEREYEFDINTDIDELIDNLDILRDAKKYGWEGFDNIYRDKEYWIENL